MTSAEKSHRMQIVGGQEVIDSDDYLEGLIRLYGSLFSRMASEVKNIRGLGRYVGYQSIINEKERLCFLGIEVDGIEDVPEGMVAWDMGEETWTARQREKGQDVLLWQKDITWQWIEGGSCGNGRCCGEFSVTGPLELAAGEKLQCRDFWISANIYAGAQEKNAGNDDVHLVDYDPSWPGQYEKIACWLEENLPAEIALRIEHYGSTAIPGMPAKPIIDVLIEIPSFAEAREHIIPILNNERWEYCWYSDHMIFVNRTKPGGQRTCHLHLAPRGDKLWEGLAFRDYLITHKDDALRYAALKQELASEYRKDRERYTEAKTAFVKEIISKALRCS